MNEKYCEYWDMIVDGYMNFPENVDYTSTEYCVDILNGVCFWTGNYAYSYGIQLPNIMRHWFPDDKNKHFINCRPSMWNIYRLHKFIEDKRKL